MNEVVICGANAYEEKYYFNPQFNRIPDSLKDDLHIICVLFTEEVGGIITIGFDEEGELKITTQAADDDFLYDEIASGMLVSRIRSSRQEMFESLSLFYRVIVCGEDVNGLLADGE